MNGGETGRKENSERAHFENGDAQSIVRANPALVVWGRNIGVGLKSGDSVRVDKTNVGLGRESDWKIKALHCRCISIA